jgi:hypothetical protein
METLQTSRQSEYSLGFLMNDDFKSEILSYIQTHFADLLDEEDLVLLKQGDEDALERLSSKIQTMYKRKSLSS